jgi:hypothetical protein
MSVTVPLSKPIKAHGDEVSELTLREPTTKDVIELGLPTLIIPGADGQSTGIEIRQPVVARYVMRLAAIPMGSVEALSLSDFSLCTAAVMGFFGQGDGETLTT